VFYLGRVPESSKLFVDATLHVANLMKADGKVDGAKEYLRQSIVKSPQIPQLYVFLASIEEEEKNLAGAVSTLERAFARFPEDEKVLYYLGSLYDRQGSVDHAVGKMKQLLFVNPKNVDALNYLGYTWTVQGKNMEQAGDYLKQAMKLRPNNAYITDSWGWYLFTTGKTRDAVVTLEKAVQIKGDEATILEHLGDAYSRANLQEKALITYQKAANLSEDAASKEKVVAKIESIRSVLVKNGRVTSGTETARRPASMAAPTLEPTTESQK
jgi:tetratricopeptide (TPR) repeat protein